MRRFITYWPRSQMCSYYFMMKLALAMTEISYVSIAILGAVRFGLSRGWVVWLFACWQMRCLLIQVQSVQVFHVSSSDTDIQANFIKHTRIEPGSDHCRGTSALQQTVLVCLDLLL